MQRSRMILGRNTGPPKQLLTEHARRRGGLARFPEGTARRREEGLHSMLHEHPVRREVVEEMHLRRWPVLSPGMRLVQIVRMVDPEEKEVNERSDLLARLASGGATSEIGTRHVSATLSGRLKLIWERHSEASTVSLFAEDAADELA